MDDPYRDVHRGSVAVGWRGSAPPAAAPPPDSTRCQTLSRPTACSPDPTAGHTAGAADTCCKQTDDMRKHTEACYRIQLDTDTRG